VCDIVVKKFTFAISSPDEFLYYSAVHLLNQFYPENTVTVTSRDPEFVTPAMKASLRRKNRLMHAGRVEEASALAARIGREIARSCQKRLCKVDGRVDSKNSEYCGVMDCPLKAFI